MRQTQDIAIVGYSFKLPQGVEDDASLWNVLENRHNLSSTWDESRLNVDSFTNNRNHKVCCISLIELAGCPTLTAGAV